MGLEEFDINIYNSRISQPYQITEKELRDNFYFHQTTKEIQETIEKQVRHLKKREGLRLTVSGRRRQRELQKRERAGKQLNAEDLKFLRDLNYHLAGVGKNKFSDRYIKSDNQINIYYKEQYYSELTFHYWFWKNRLKEYLHNDSVWIGFCQKRRFWIKKIPKILILIIKIS